MDATGPPNPACLPLNSDLFSFNDTPSQPGHWQFRFRSCSGQNLSMILDPFFPSFLVPPVRESRAFRVDVENDLAPCPLASRRACRQHELDEFLRSSNVFSTQQPERPRDRTQWNSEFMAEKKSLFNKTSRG